MALRIRYKASHTTGQVTNVTQLNSW